MLLDYGTAAMRTQRDSSVISRVASVLLLAPIIVLIIPLVITMLIGMVIYGASLTAVVWLAWCTRGVDTLVVYSNSPNWHDYMVETVLPRLQGRSVVINWSERRHWKWHSLPVAVFRFFGGDREFNPIVIVLRPLKLPRTFRFWQPFRDRKHGDTSSLHDVESRLYTYLDINEPHVGGRPMKSQDDIDSDISSAIERDDAETLRDIIRSNSMVAHESLGGWLVIASYCGKLSALKVLLELDANVNWMNDDGETPFSYACAYNQFESAKLLHEHGANINSVHASGCTPLDIAVCHANPAFREWLKRIGATRNTAHDEWPWPPPSSNGES